VDFGGSRNSASRYADVEQADHRPLRQGPRHCARGIDHLPADDESWIGGDQFARATTRTRIGIADEDGYSWLCSKNYGDFATLTPKLRPG
jgi:hypothetical protein